MEPQTSQGPVEIKKKPLYTIIFSIVIVVALIALGVFFGKDFVTQNSDNTFKIGDTKTISGATITLKSISNDSRCPIGVTCIWEGTAAASIDISVGGKVASGSVNLRDAINLLGYSILFDSLTPPKKEGAEITSGEYEATFEISKSQAENKQYENKEFGFSFSYPPHYFLEEKDDSQPGLTHIALFLSEDTEENRAVREGKLPGREGPTGVSIDVYKDELTSPTLIEWLKDSPSSNYHLSSGAYQNTKLANGEAVTYHWSGLYEGRTVATSHNGYILAISATYFDLNDESNTTVFDVVTKTLAFTKGTVTKDDLIIVSSPKPQAKVASPLAITGSARGNWYFEASFPIVILDANGKTLGEGHAEAQADWMTTDFVPFKATLTFTKPGTKIGTLILKKDNPSGLPQNDDSIQIPVTF